MSSRALDSVHFISGVNFLAATYIVILMSLPSGLLAQQKQPDPPKISLKEACPDANDKGPTSGSEAVARAQKQIETMKGCIEALIAALKENPDKDSVDANLKQAIDAAQASVNRIRGQDGLMEVANLYLNRLKNQRKEIPRQVPKDQQESRAKELDGLIAQATDGIEKLDKASKDLNETIIYLNSKRPEIAYDLSLRDTADKVNALNRAIGTINKASEMLKTIGKGLGSDKPSF